MVLTQAKFCMTFSKYSTQLETISKKLGYTRSRTPLMWNLCAQQKSLYYPSSNTSNDTVYKYVLMLIIITATWYVQFWLNRRVLLPMQLCRAHS